MQPIRMMPGAAVRTHFERRIVLYILVAAILAMGIVVGALSVGVLDGPARADLAEYLRGYFLSLQSAPPVEPNHLVRATLMGEILRTVGLICVLGLSIIGSPLILVVVFFRGFVLGFALAFMVADLWWRGAVLAFVSVVPQNLFALPAVIVASVAGVAFSLGAGKILLGRHMGETIFRHLAAFLGAASICTVLLLLSGLVEGYVTPTLVRVVSGYLLR